MHATVGAVSHPRERAQLLAMHAVSSFDERQLRPANGSTSPSKTLLSSSPGMMVLMCSYITIYIDAIVNFLPVIFILSLHLTYFAIYHLSSNCHTIQLTQSLKGLFASALVQWLGVTQAADRTTRLLLHCTSPSLHTERYILHRQHYHHMTKHSTCAGKCHTTCIIRNLRLSQASHINRIMEGQQNS